LGKRDVLGFLPWVLPGYKRTLKFEYWRTTKTTPPPSESEKDPDQLAVFTQLLQPGPQWLFLIEWQTIVSAKMFGRLLQELGQLWQTHLPDEANEQDRFQVAAAVINLTGSSNSMPASQQYVLPLQNDETGLPLPEAPACVLRVREIYLEEESAQETLNRIESGEIGEIILGLIPLMKDGGDDTIITRWKDLVNNLKKHWLRSDICSAALIFSDLKEWSDKWHAAIEGDSKMLESVTLNRWLAEGEKIGLDKGEKIGLDKGEKIGLDKGLEKGEKIGLDKGLEKGEKIGLDKGVVKGLQETLREWLLEKFQTLPTEIQAKITATDDPVALRRALRSVDSLAKVEDLVL
jgi:hypothetical protein